MAHYDLRFVAAIAPDAPVRLELRAAPYNVRAGTDLGVPELRRATVSTLMADGDRHPASAYGNRHIHLVVAVDGVDDDATAAAVQALIRELDRPANVLQWRPGTTEPIYFRTFRAAPGSVVWDPATKELRVPIPAEPFGYGSKVVLPPVTVSNDPAGGQHFVVSDVRGDVETPLFLSIPNADIRGGSQLRQAVISVRRRGTPSAAPYVLQAEEMSAVTDTALGAAHDPAMSGSGRNFLRITFATVADTTSRATHVMFPPSPSVDVRGTYRVYARCRKSVAADQITLQLAVQGRGGHGVVLGDVVTTPTWPGIRYVDLGLVQLPVGADPVVDGYSESPLSAQGAGVILFAARGAGSGTLDLDCLIWVPADDRLLLAQWINASDAERYVIDSSRTMAYAVGAEGEVISAGGATLAGDAPMVSPGVTNSITWVQDVGTRSGGDVVTNTTTITAYYWPRYLVAGVTQ